MIRAVSLDDKYIMRARSLQAVRDDLSGPVTTLLGAALERARRCHPRGLGAGLAKALSSLKVTSNEELDFDQLLQALEAHESSIARQLQVLGGVFIDPPTRILHKAWEGFCVGVGRFGGAALFGTLLFSFLGLGRTTLLTSLYFFTIHIGHSAQCEQFFSDVLAFFILDEPHPRDPLGVLEDIIGDFLKLVVYGAVSIFTLSVCVENYGKYWSPIKAFLFWNIIPALACSLAIAIIFLILYGCYLVGGFISKTSYTPSQLLTTG